MFSTWLRAGGAPRKEDLRFLQRGFDFYSWRTFIALNAPADGSTPIDHSQADMPTLHGRTWGRGFGKQLLDVMLPVGTSWPPNMADGR